MRQTDEITVKVLLHKADRLPDRFIIGCLSQHGMILVDADPAENALPSVEENGIAIGAEDATLDENGYVSVYKMAFDMNIDVETSGIVVGTEASVEMEITFKNPGTAVTITPPEGYQDFPEVDLDALM